MSTARKLNSFYQKLVLKEQRIKENNHNETILYYLRNVDTTIEKLRIDDNGENFVHSIIQMLLEYKEELLTFIDNPSVSLEGYFDELRDGLKMKMSHLMDMNQKRASNKRNIKEQLDEQKKSTKVKLEWLISSFEMQTIQRIDALNIEVFKDNSSDSMKDKILNDIYSYNSLIREFEKIQENIMKSIDRFYVSFNDEFELNQMELDDFSQIFQLDYLMNVIDLNEDARNVEAALLASIYKKGLSLGFSKTKRLTQLRVDLKDILEKRVIKVKEVVKNKIEDEFIQQKDKYDVFIDKTFDKYFCPINKINQIIRDLDDLDQSFNKNSIAFTIRELIKYG